MKTIYLKESNLWGRVLLWGKEHWWQIVVPGLFFVWMYLFYPFRNIFMMDPDEGINLVKAQMLLRGFSLYVDIWNDQPPLFTYFLAGLFRIFGLRVNLARVFILLLACGLFYLYLNYLYVVWGKLHSLVGIVLLIGLPNFTYLSVSVMIGLPSITFAMLSLVALVYWHKQRRYHWLILSAVGLGFSILIKLFTGFLAPIFLLGILVDEFTRYLGTKNWRKVLFPGILWGTILTFVVVVPILLLVHPENLGQLLESHISGSQVDIFKNDPTLSLSYHLINARVILFIAILGIFEVFFKRQWLALYPVAWMLTAFALLYNHTPVWYHQQLLITIPAAILASGAVGNAFHRIKEIYIAKGGIERWDIVRLFTLVGFVFVLVTRVPETISAFNPTPSFRTPPFREASTEVAILSKIREYSAETKWFVTDLPIYVFYSDLSTPPNLVVFSSKRVKTGNLSEEEILRTIEKLEPEQILFGRNRFPLVQQYLDENYQVMFVRDPIYLYLKNEIAPDPNETSILENKYGNK